MNCEQIRVQMGAWVDGQLGPHEARELESHLAICSACQVEAENLRTLHADLVHAFQAPRAAAARAAERALASLPPHAEAAIVTQRSRWPNLLSLALATTIGFLLAVLIFRPWKSPLVVPRVDNRSKSSSVPGESRSPTQEPSDPSIVRLVVATRAAGVEVIDPKRKSWEPVAEISKFQCPTEGCVRTDSGVRCELVTSEGCVVRMNSGSEIVVHSPGRIELRRGEIWCRSSAAAPLEIIPALSSAIINQALSTKPVLTCAPSDAACSLKIAEAGDKVSVTSQTGRVDVKAHDKSLELGASESATITGEQVRREHSSDALLNSSWMQPLLIRKGHANRELAERVDDLLARVGETKQPEIYETEIRSLGEYSVLPLLRYVESPRSDSNPRRREAAMRIISDMAPAWAIGDLVGLLKHPDADVRTLSAVALGRLTQQTQGITPDKWRGPPANWRPAVAAWQTWWTKNSDRFPHLPETPQP
jgi:hypothetical protein